MFSLLSESYGRWGADRANRMAAALSFSITFAAAPLLVVGITIAGLVLEQESVQRAVVSELTAVLGAEAAGFVYDVLASTSEVVGRSGPLPPAVALLVTFFGASGVVGALRGALNDIWGVRRKPRRGLVQAIMGTVRERLFYLAVALGVGLILLVSLSLNTALAAAVRHFAQMEPGTELILRLGNYLLSIILATAVFAVMFGVIPDVQMAWKDALVGAGVTSLLFNVGQVAISIYLARSTAASVYGAAGSIVVILLWIYYSMQVFFYGAEFTQVYAERHGAGIRPSPSAYVLRYDRVTSLGASEAGHEPDTQEAPARV